MLRAPPQRPLLRAYPWADDLLAHELTSRRDTGSLTFFGLLARLVSASVLATWLMVAADACVRSGWPYISIGRHVAAALGLYAMVGALLGLLISALVWLEWRGLGRRWRGSARRTIAKRALCYGLVAALASMSTAMYTFSGEHVARTLARRIGPLVFMLALGTAAAIGSALLLGALAGLQKRDRLRFWPIVALFFAVGGGLVWVDLTQYVSLYSRIHTILELASALTLGSALALVLEALSVRFRVFAAWLPRFAGLCCAWLLAFILVAGVRAKIDDWLRHVWLEEAYVGRVLRREQIAEAFFKDPLHWRGLYLSRVERLRERYPLGAPLTAPEWHVPPADEPAFAARLDALRGPLQRYNVIVYYVDTLRDDVARNPKIMPHVARFAERSLDFRRAYATGSDTLRSLPAITGGNYDVSATPDNDLLRVAARAGYDRRLVIAKSAHEFIGKLRPEFKFDRAIDVQDYPAEMQVWGYGAQRTTAGPVVDRALEYVASRRHTERPFLLWLFNFDQHNWRELDRNYVTQQAEAHDLTIESDRDAWRYDAVAAGIDAQFGRLLTELERQKQLENTIVLFLSDHGEALGRDGFWVHSVFLWEQLIRVPLILHVPGFPAQRIDDRVSLVDLAPTLSRFMQDKPSQLGYQGQDLLGALLPGHPPRRLPLLLTAAAKDVLVRVGLVDPVRDWKIVLSLEAALPELYALGTADPDAANLAEANEKTTLELARALFHSPVFPRSAEDFDLRDTKEQRALWAAEEAAAKKN